MKTLTCTLSENLNRIATGCINYIKIVFITALLVFAQHAQAAAPSSGITYTGRILDSNDQPVTASQVYFTITISDPDQKCWLYTEQRLVDMSASSGNFAFEVGSNDPTTLYGTPSLNNPLGGGPATFADIFDNSKSFSSLAVGTYASCPGSYNPSTSSDKYEGRVMAIFFRIGAAGTDQALPALRITPVPLAMQAINTAKVNGYDTNHLLRIDPSIASPTNSDLNGTQLSEFFRLVNNPGTAYLSSIPTLGGDVSGTLPSVSVDKIKGVAVTAPVPADTGKVLTFNASSGLVWQTAASGGITGLNGLTNATQSFATGATGTDFNISSAGSTHTFNLPSSSASNRGLLTSADWSTFNAKQSSSLATGQVWIGNAAGSAEAHTLSGDASISTSGIVTVDKTQTGAASKIMQLDSSGIAVSQGADVKGTGGGSLQIRYANSASNNMLTFPASSGSANQFLQTDGAGNLSWGSQSALLPTLTSGQIWVGNASGGAQGFALSGDIASVSNTGAVTLTASATGANKLPLAGGSMSGNINMGANDITNAGNISMAANKYFGLSANGTDGTVPGQMWYDTGVIKYFDGTTVKSLGVAGSGISNLNGLSSNTQSFVVGSAGNAPAITSSGSAHTFDFPMASASGSVTAGLISNADYVAFSGKQSTSLAAGQVWVGNASGAAQAFALSGDVASVSNTGSVTVNKTTTAQNNTILALDGSGVGNVKGIGFVNTGTVTLSAQTASATYGLKFPAAAPGNNQILQSNATGDLSWVNYLANVSNSAPLTNGKMWIGNASGVAAEVVMSGDATIDNAGLLTLKNTGSVGTYFKVTTDAQGRVVSGANLASGDITTALGYTPVNKAGDTMSGDLMLAAGKFLGLGSGSTAGTVAGQIWYDAGTVKYFDGTTTKALGVAGAGITNLNGLAVGTQSFVAGSAGTDFAISSSGSAHTFNLPSSSASNRGLLTSADWTTFNSKQDNALTAASVWVGNAAGGAQARALSGDVTISNVGLVSLKNTGSVGTYYKVVTDAQGRVVSGTSSMSTTDLPSLADGKMWIGDSGNTATAYAMSGDATMSNVGLLTLKNTGSVGTYFKVTTDAQGRVVSGANLASGDITTALGYTPVNKAGDTMSGDLNTQNIVMAANKYLGLSANTTNGTVAGQMWYDTGTIKYFDGTTVKSLGVAGSGITSLNGLSTNTQSFVVGSAGNAPAVTSAGSAHTFDFPMASASGSVTAGLISNADYVSFSGKQSTSLASAQVWVGNASGVAQARALSGDISISNVGLVTADKTTTGQANKLLSLDGTGVANVKGLDVQTGTGKVTLQTAGAFTNYILTLPAAGPAANQIMQSDASGNLSWVSNVPSVNNAASLAAGKMWLGNASGVAVEQTMSGDATITNAGLLTLKNTGTVGTYFKVTTDAQGRVVSGANLASSDITTALGYTPVNKAGDTMSGDLMLAAGKFLGLGSGSTPGTVAGQIWYDAGTVKYFDGTTTKSLGVAGAGITNLNGLAVGTQSFVVGSAGTDFAISSSGSAHTFDLPSSSASNRGLLTSADWTTFNNKQANALSSASVWVGNSAGGAQARALSGDVTISNVGLVSLASVGAAGTYFKVVTDAQGRVVSGTSSMGTADLPTLADTKIWIGNSASTATAYSISGDATMSNVGLLSLKNTGSVGTYFKVTTDAQGRVVSGANLASGDITTALGYTPVNKAGDTMSGDLNTQNIVMAANKYLGLSANSTNGTVAGQMWYDTGTIKYFDGTTTKSLGVAGAGITTLNGLSTTTQSFVIGSAGNAPAVSSAGSAHTFNFPMASASGSVTAGLISNADYVSFSGKQSSSLAAGQMWVGNASGVAQAFALSGDVSSVSNTGSVVVNKTTTAQNNMILALDGSGVGNVKGIGFVNTGTVTLSAQTSSATYGLKFPAAAPAANQIMQSDASGNFSWVSNVPSVNNAASLANGKMWLGNASGVAVEQTMSGDATISNAGLLTLKNTGTLGTYYKVVTDAQGRVTSGSALVAGDITTALGYTPVNKAGDTMTGDLMLGAGKFLGLGSGSTAGTVAGQIWYDSGVVKYFDGTTTKALGVAGAGITTLNGLSTVTQTFGTGTSGSDFNISSAGSGHIFNIPSASSSNRGALTSADWTTFNNKQANALTSASVWVGNSAGGAEARALSGDVTISNVGLVSLKNTGSIGTYYKVVTDAQGRVVSGTSSMSTTDMPSLADTKIWIGNSASTATAYSISGDATMSNVGLLSLKNTGTVGTYFKVTTDAQGRVVSGANLASGDITTALGYTPVNKAGDTMTGDLNTLNITMAANKYLGLSANSTNGTVAGQMWYDTGVIKYFDGTTTKSLGVAGAGITTLNGLSTVTQTFGTGTSGSDFNISSAGSGHIFNFPSSSASNRGLLTSADWTTFNSKQSSTLAAGQMWVGNASGTAQAFALSGDVSSVSNTGSVVVNKTTTAQNNMILSLDGSGVGNVKGIGFVNTGTVTLSAQTSSATYGLKWPAAAPAANQILQSDASGNFSWVSNAANVNNAASLTAGKIWIGNASGIAVENTMSGDATISNVGLLTLKNTGTLGTYYKVVTDAQGRVTSGSALVAGDITTALGYTPVNKAGDTMSGLLNHGGFDITNTGNISMAANKYLGLSANTTAGTVAGQMWYDTGVIKYYDGTTTKSLGVAGAGITTLNGLSTVTQTFGTGTSGSDFNISSAGSGHIFNIPSASSSNRGALTSADWTTFNSKQDNALTSASVWVGNSAGGAQARALSGDVTISNVGLVTLKNTGTVGTYWKVITDAQGRVSSGAALLSGDVTSALGFTPASSTGFMANTLAAGQMWVGNASGVAQAFALSGDVSSVSNTGSVVVNKTTTAQNNMILSLDGSGVGNVKGIGFVNTGTVTLSAQTSSATYGLKWPAAAPAANQILQSDASGNFSWVSNAANVNNAASLTAGKIWIGNASGIAVENTMSGDATISNVGLLTLKNTGTVGTYWKVITDAQGRVSSGAALLSADVTSALGFTPTAAGAGYINGGNSFAGNATIGLNDNYNLGIKTGGSTRMTVDSTGNVGIGTTAPTALVDVQATNSSPVIHLTNNVGNSTNYPAFQVTNYMGTSNLGNPRLALQNYRTSAGSPVAVQSGDILGDITAQGSTGVGYNTSTTSMIQFIATQTFSGTAAGGSIALSTVPNNSTTSVERVRIDHNGNVGIGITSPTVSLDIGSKTDAIRLPVGNASQQPANATGLLRYNTTSSSVEFNNGAAWAPLASSSNGYINGGNSFAGNATIGLNDAYNLGFETGGTTKMTLTSGGNLGIGTATPGSKLYVSGGGMAVGGAGGFIQVDPDTSDGSRSKISMNSPYNNIATQYWTGVIYDNGNGYISFGGGAPDLNVNFDSGSTVNYGNHIFNKLSWNGSAKVSTEVMRLDNVGRLGLGTTSPAVAIDAGSRTDAIRVPVGNTSQRPSNATGLIRYNTTIGNFEFNNGAAWSTPLIGVNNTASLTAGKIWIGNASGIAVENTMSGDATISNVGLLTLKNTGTVGTYWKVVTDAQGRVSSGSALLSADVTSALGFTPASAGSGFVQGGNTFGTAANFGINDNFDINFRTNGTTKMQLSSGGALGIGSTSGSYPLEVARTGTANDTSAILVNIAHGTDGTLGSLNTFLGGHPSATGGNRYGFIGVGDAAAMRPLSLNSNGQGQTGIVGIGTDQPGSRLHIVDTNIGAGNLSTNVQIQATGSTAVDNGGMLTFSGNDGTSDGRMFVSIAGRKEVGTAGNTSGYFQIQTRNNATGLAERMRVTSAGNVGIGTTNPTTALQVNNGTISVSGIALNAGTAAFSAGNGSITAGAGGTSSAGGGQIYAGAYSGSSGVIDFNRGNVQTTSYDCASGTIELDNMQSGGSYTVVVTSATTNKCDFKDGAGGTAFTAASYAPSNTTRTASSHTVYTFVKIGARVYVSWIAGFSTTQ